MLYPLIIITWCILVTAVVNQAAILKTLTMRWEYIPHGIACTPIHTLTRTYGQFRY